MLFWPLFYALTASTQLTNWTSTISLTLTLWKLCPVLVLELFTVLYILERRDQKYYKYTHGNFIILRLVSQNTHTNTHNNARIYILCHQV